MRYSIETAGTLMMDSATICFLGGILVYTTMYRRRGRLDDRLFFAMIILNMVMAAVEVVNYMLLESGLAIGGMGITVGDTIFLICFELFPFLYVLYLDYFVNADAERIRKKLLRYSLPCLAMVALIIANVPGKFLFSAVYVPQMATNQYTTGSLYDLVFLGAAVYCVIIVLTVYKVEPIRVVMLGLIVGARILWGVWFRGISATAFLFSVILAYSHIISVNRSIGGDLL